MAGLQKKALADCSVHELRSFALDVENIDFPEDGIQPGRMSGKQLASELKARGYTHAYVSTAPAAQEGFDVQKFAAHDAATNIALTPDTEHWFQIRIHDAEDLNGKSKNVPVPVSFNDDSGYLPRGVPLWTRGRFVHCLREATQGLTVQTGRSFANERIRREVYRYPFEVLQADPTLVRDGLPKLMQPGELVIYDDRNAKAGRAHMDRAREWFASRSPSSIQPAHA